MRRTLALLSALACVLALAQPSQAGAVRKSFHESLTITPAGPLAVSTGYQLQFVLTNDVRSPQAFASAQILVPTGYVLGALSTDVSGFTAGTFSGGILVTSTGPTSSGIAPGASLTVTAAVTTPSTASCRATWTTYVKQSNDFSGSGNDYAPADPAPTTTVGASHLAFSTQPHLTQWDTAMSPAPVVRALDPCGSTDTSFTGSVTVTDAAAHLATGSPVTAVAGVATLTGLTFDDFGFTDTLTATASGFASATSSSFDVLQAVVPCEAGKSCTTGKLSDRAGTTLVSITAASGTVADTLTATVKGDPSVFGTCGQPAGTTPAPPLGSIVTFNVTSRAKTVTMTLPRAYVNAIPNNGTPFMDICLSVPTGSEFVDKFGQTTTTGLLPDCTTTRTTVCITERRKNAGNEVMTMVLPPGDPQGSWF